MSLIGMLPKEVRHSKSSMGRQGVGWGDIKVRYITALARDDRYTVHDNVIKMAFARSNVQ
jgi:hypothetical protein